MAIKKVLLTTDIFNALVIIHYSVSTNLAIWSELFFAMEMFIVLMTGRAFWNQLFALAYNLGNFLRRLALPKKVKQWSLRILRTKLIKIGAKVVKHARYATFQMAEVLVSKRGTGWGTSKKR